jgi:hypothetical protein
MSARAFRHSAAVVSTRFLFAGRLWFASVWARAIPLAGIMV